MIKTKDYCNELESKFQAVRGKGSAYIFNSMFPFIVAITMAVKVINKNDKRKVLIVVEKYDNKIFIEEALKELCDNTYEFYRDKINIITEKFINFKYNYCYDLIITIGINSNIELIEKLNSSSKFTLVILTENIMNGEFIDRIRDILPDITIPIVNNDIVCESSPVEEYRYGVTIEDSDYELYTKYNNYIKESMVIFDNLDNINKCRVGDLKNNISAFNIRYQIAIKNGWSYNLDTSIEYNKMIDNVYNPNVLLERAEVIYNIIRERRNLIINNPSKINKILETVISEIDNNKTVLIVSKSGEFAANVTKAINEYYGSEICGDYHDCIEDKYFTDNNGKVICYGKKSKNAGEPKIFKAKAISSRNEELFNKGVLKVLSIKNSSSNKLKIAVNSIILSSPLLDNVIDIRKRFIEVRFIGKITKAYKVYCRNTIEQQSIIDEQPIPMVRTFNDFENSIEFDAKTGTIIL